jgi:histidyl-tRNA synthetase
MRIGIPLRVTLGAKSLAQGEIELRDQTNSETTLLPVANAAKEITARVMATRGK